MFVRNTIGKQFDVFFLKEERNYYFAYIFPRPCIYRCYSITSTREYEFSEVYFQCVRVIMRSLYVREITRSELLFSSSKQKYESHFYLFDSTRIICSQKHWWNYLRQITSQFICWKRQQKQQRISAWTTTRICHNESTAHPRNPRKSCWPSSAIRNYLEFSPKYHEVQPL